MPHAGRVAGVAGAGPVLESASRVCGEHQPHSRGGAVVQVELSAAHGRQEADGDSREPLANAAAAGAVQSVAGFFCRASLKAARATIVPIAKMETNAEAAVMCATCHH